MDYCEWLKDATFVRCIGSDCGWGESLSAFGSSVITHHPLTPIQREKCGHDPQRDPFVYAGLPMVTLAGPADLVVAHPTAAVGVIRDGDRGATKRARAASAGTGDSVNAAPQSRGRES